VTAVLAVLGVLVFDGSSLLVERVAAADHADTAAQAAADSWHQQHSYPAAVAAAEDAAGSDEVVPDSLKIASDGSTTLSLHRVVSTLVVRHLPRVKELASVTAAGNGRPPLS
jgi:hypothetical protein